MSYVTLEDKVESLEAMVGLFMKESAIIQKRQEQRDQLAEKRHHEFVAESKARNADADKRHHEFVAESKARSADADKRHHEFVAESKARNADADKRHHEFVAEMRADRKEMNKKWGDLSNKLGTIAEDIFAPNMKRFAREDLKLGEVLHLMPRSTRRSIKTREEDEFDVIAVTESAVLIGEAKSKPKPEHAAEVIEKLSTYFDYFPEHKGLKLIPMYGSWSIPESIVRVLSKHGIYAVQMGEDTMEIINANQIEKKKKA